ncbi:MAG: hypothetical protein RLZZ37_1064 [Actinomycetota bacterium]
MKYLFSIILLSILVISPAKAEVTVESNQESESYKVTGELILDETFNGSFESQKQAETCQGCRWIIAKICYLDDEDGSIKNCSGAAESCNRPDGETGRKMKVWRKLGEDEPWLSVGLICLGPNGPVTPSAINFRINEQSIEYLPKLIPSTQPSNHVLVNTDIFFISNQNRIFGPKNLIITGIPITLTASASWTWDFGDGTVIETLINGAGYPNGEIKHIYETKGLKTITVSTNWQAKWSTKNNLDLPVMGKNLVQKTTFNLLVHEARAVLTR